MKRGRILAPILLFVVLAGAGTGWLVHVARSAPTGTPAGDVRGLDPRLAETSDAPGEFTSAPAEPPTIATVGPPSPVAAATPSAVATTRPAGSARTPEPGGPAAGPPSPQATAEPAAPPVPVRAIRVGGVTLDDTNPRTMCYAVRNLDSPVTVRITALSAGNPDVVIRPDRCADVLVQENPPRQDWTPAFPCRAGVDLRPDGDGCYTGIEPRSDALEGNQVHSSFTVSLRARCTSAAGLPCQDSGSPAPTAERPVDVTWTQQWRGPDLCIGLPASDTAFCVPAQS